MTPHKNNTRRARRNVVVECIPLIEDAYTPTQLQLQRRANLMATRTACELRLEAELIDRKIAFEPQSLAQGFFVDFRILPYKLAVEVDGWYHDLNRKRRDDEWRSNILFKNGWSIIRFHNTEIQKNVRTVADWIVKAIAMLEETPEHIVVRLIPTSTKQRIR